MIEFQRVSKAYGDHWAVRDVSFRVERGEILGFLGPNGAGKSTAMRILTGYLAPTSGHVTVAGLDLAREPFKVKAKIGYLPEHPPLYGDMTAREYLGYVAQLKDVPARSVNGAVSAVAGAVGLDMVTNRLLKNLSKGYQQRVGLAQALLGDPEVLVLDEPTVGLDPGQIREIRQLIAEQAGQRTIILSTHILPEVGMLCQRVLIINQGRVVAQDRPENLSQAVQGGERLSLLVKGERDGVKEALCGVSGVTAVAATAAEGEGVYRYHLELGAGGGQAVREQIFYALAEKSWPLLEMTPQRVSLEEIFVQLITEEKGEAHAQDVADRR